ncbi:hypothetical protein DS901_06460 [Loktanella sp. D2R18]|uniref:hypothetical protein n=1 Tax=Rhodobacterales TaxID=204455 RepID=UPI000DE98FB5|nr:MULTISPECIES: hypothetical protein [Rhodobacterales]MDO6591840.1 hypothetical protein [Yoonia sp. 1_MG-2023]RBW44861.1 hypothetical protein DS901_06460 [Loktanella sp. D2R18]
MAGDSGATPLTDKRLEAFCKLIALEEKSQAAAWTESAPTQITFESASNGGSRAMRRKNVADRIAWLRKERAAAQAATQPIQNDPLIIMATVSEVLKKAYIAAKEEGFPAAKLAMVRKAWSMHVGRFSAMKVNHKPVAVSSGIEATSFWDKIGGCECHK